MPIVMKRNNSFMRGFLLTGLCLLLFSGAPFAQDVIEGKEAAPVVVGAEITPDDIPSLLYQDWEYISLRDAIAARYLIDPDAADVNNGGVKILTEEELALLEKPAKAPLPEEELVPIDPGIRILRLNGIVYVSQDDWTIWFNQERITPRSDLPEEITSLRVDQDFIEITWLDNYTNNIFPIRLRPNQRFDLDSRIFLPGQK